MIIVAAESEEARFRAEGVMGILGFIGFKVLLGFSTLPYEALAECLSPFASLNKDTPGSGSRGEGLRLVQKMTARRWMLPLQVASC